MPTQPAPDSGGPSMPLNDIVTVTAVQITVDPLTLDRLFVVHSEERAPILLRVSPIELPGILRDLALAIARSLH